MSWPSLTDYNDAIQNPGRCFDDPDLKAAKVRRTRLGLPDANSGNFACVYRLHSATAVWGVRCFLRDIPTRKRRYLAILEQLKAKPLPYFVEFSYIDSGIFIRAKRASYPVLKMRWIEGVPLTHYVQEHHASPEQMRDLATRWCRMLADLRRAGIAHGDLQHGNILVVGDELRLVDYDGMYVPALAGLQNDEGGHRSYQHPSRSKTDFGPHLDHFAGWVIYLSLVALSLRPNLWAEFMGPQAEQFLFSRDSLRERDTAPIFQRLLRDDKPEVRDIALRLLKLLGIPRLADIPPIDLGEKSSFPMPNPIMAPSSWIQHESSPVPMSAVDVGVGASWISQHLPALSVTPGPYQIGERIRHTKFGSGRVIGLRKELVEINFDDGVTKIISTQPQFAHVLQRISDGRTDATKRQESPAGQGISVVPTPITKLSPGMSSKSGSSLSPYLPQANSAEASPDTPIPSWLKAVTQPKMPPVGSSDVVTGQHASPSQCSVPVRVIGGGTTDPKGNLAGPIGTVIRLRAIPALGHRFTGWIVDGTASDLNKPLAKDGWFNLNQAVTLVPGRKVTARFAVDRAFLDVKIDTPYRQSVLELAARGIVKGDTPELSRNHKPERSFFPNELIQRGSFSSAIVRAFGWEAAPPLRYAFIDLHGIDSVLKRDISILAAKNVVTGYSDGYFRPFNHASKLEVVSLVTRAMVAAGYWKSQLRTASPTSQPYSSHSTDVMTYEYYYHGSMISLIGRHELSAASRAWAAYVLWQALNIRFSVGRVL